MPQPSRQSARQIRVRVAPAVVALVLLGVATSLGGCRRVLFRETADRTQFDSYDRIRDGVAPPFVFDEFGYRQPNLRERLLPTGPS